MRKITFFLLLVLASDHFLSAQTTLTTLTSFSTIIKSNHNFGLTNPVFDQNSPMTYNPTQVNVLGAAFSINYINQGGTGFDGYPSGTVGGYKTSGTYYSGNKSVCGMPIQIKDLTNALRINWKTSQMNANDVDDKWWATINVIFDSGTETSEPVTENRDYDLVIQNVGYEQEDLTDFINPGGRYWYFARESKDGPIKPFTVYLNGVPYSWAVRYKFFDYPVGHAEVDKNDKVHVKFIPIDNSKPIPNLDHSLKQFIDCATDYLNYLPLLTDKEKNLANLKVAESTLWIKSISAGYEIYEGASTLNNDYFYTTLDNTPPSELTNLAGVEQSGNVVLNWDASTDTAFDTYTIYRSENGGDYTEVVSNLRENNYIDNAVSNQYYSYYVTAKDRSFNESNVSNTINLNLSSVSLVTKIFTVVDDAHVREGIYQNDKFGSNENMQIREISSANNTRQVYLKFDLTTVDNAISATLRLNNTGANGDVDVKKVVDDSWSESTIDWNSKPVIGTAIGTFQFNNLGTFDMDVTSYVSTEVHADKIVSFALTGATTNFMTVSSKEGVFASQLIVLYNDGSNLGVADLPETDENDMIIYPNPTHSEINFKTDKSNLKIIKVEVFDNLGRLIQQEIFFKPEQSIEIKGVAGTYILKIYLKDTVIIKKVVKQ